MRRLLAALAVASGAAAQGAQGAQGEIVICGLTSGAAAL
jgi:hypothetical protein